MDDVKVNRIEIELSNGYKLVAEKNADQQFSREMIIGIVDSSGVWYQDLAVVRSNQRYDGDKIVWNDKQFDVLVYGDDNNEDYTEEFSVGLHEETE